jgi:hypothetical protein
MNRILVGVAVTVAAAYAVAATPTTATTAAAPAATVSAPVEAVAPTAKKVTLSYVAESAIGAQAANKGNWEGNAASTQHLGVAYDLGNAKKVQFRQYFLYNSTDPKATDEWSIGEHVFQYTDAKSFNVAGTDVLSYARVYLPGSEYIKEVGQYQVRLVNGVSQKLGKATVDYGLQNRFYTYTGSDDGQLRYRLIPSVEASYKVNSTLTPFAGAYMDIRRNNSGSGVLTLAPSSAVGTKVNPDNDDRRAGIQFGSGISINKNIALKAYFETEVKSHKASVEGNRLFGQDTQTYYLDLVTSL